MCVIWGIPYLLIRVAVRDVTPGTLVFLRTAIGGLVLLPLALSRGGFGPVLRRWAPLLAFTVIEMAVPWLMLSDAERHLSSSLSGLLIAAVPLVGVVVARLAGAEEPVDRLRMLGLGIGIVGVAMLVGLDFGEISVGALLEVLVVVIGYATAPVIMSRRLADLPSIPVVCASLLLVAIAYLPFAVLQPPTDVPANGWWSITTLALVCTALAFVLFFALINAIGPARATVITYVNPAVAILFGVLLLSEPFTLGMGVGFPLILVGSVLAARRREPAAANVPAGAEAVICETLDHPAARHPAPGAQSMRTGPDAVSNRAASSPVPSLDGSRQVSSTPSRG